jgi:hypothetical protein
MSDSINKEELLAMLKEVVLEAVEAHPLSPDEVHWVRLAIKAEVDRAALRKAIIEKTLTGLVWTVLCAIGVYFIDWFSAHWISSK